MPGYITLTLEKEALAALHKIATNVDQLVEATRTPNQLSIKELSEPGSGEEMLLVGSVEMSLLYGENGIPYPDELQPANSITPDVNLFRYEQIRLGSDLIYVEGNFKANDIPQVPTATLNAYNTANGTTFFSNPSAIKPEEYLKISLKTFPGMARTIEDSRIDHLWTNTDSGDDIDWLEPLSAIAIPDSQLIKLKYDEKDGQYPVVFGGDLLWSVDIEFAGFIKAYMPDTPEE